MAALRKEEAEDLHLGCGWNGGCVLGLGLGLTLGVGVKVGVGAGLRLRFQNVFDANVN